MVRDEVSLIARDAVSYFGEDTAQSLVHMHENLVRRAIALLDADVAQPEIFRGNVLEHRPTSAGTVPPA